MAEKKKKRTTPEKQPTQKTKSGKGKKQTKPIGTGLNDLFNETGIPVPKQADENEVLESLESVIAEKNELKEKYDGVKREHTNLKKKMARLGEKEKKLEETLAEAEKELKILESWQATARAILNNTAVLLYEAEMDNEAIEVFKKILKLDPDNELVRENLKTLGQADI